MKIDIEKTNEYSLQLCENKEDLSKIAKLRYECYLNVNAIKENSDREFTDKYDFMQNCKSSLIYENTDLVASVRACVYHPTLNYFSIPAFEVYYDDIKSALGLDKVIVESNRFVIAHDKIDSKIIFKIPFRHIILNINRFHADYIITAVREKHVPLYKRFLTLEVISKPKKYPGIDVDMVLMVGDNRKNLQTVIDKETYYTIPSEEVTKYSLESHYEKICG